MKKVFVFFLLIHLFTVNVSANNIMVTPEDFGCVSNNKAMANENSIALQKAIDYCIANGVRLASCSGRSYYISKGLDIPKYIDIDFGGAVLIATDSINMLTIHCDKTEYWTGVLRNFRLNMNNVAKKGIDCSNVIKFHICDGEIKGIGTNAIGLSVEKGYELLVDNLHFHGNGKYSTGVKIMTSDCHFSDCVMIDCYTAVDNQGSNFYERIHAWMLSRYIDGSIYFRNRAGLVFLNQCFSDTYDKSFVVDNICEMHISQLKLIHNKIMWKQPFDKVSPVVFDFRNNQVASQSKISLTDSYIGSLVLDNVERMSFANTKNALQITNTTIKLKSK